MIRGPMTRPDHAESRADHAGQGREGREVTWAKVARGHEDPAVTKEAVTRTLDQMTTDDAITRPDHEARAVTRTN